MRGRFTWATSTTWATVVCTVVLVTLATALPSLAQPAHESIKLDVGGVSRSFLLYRPNLATAANTPASTAASTTLPGAAVALRTATPAGIPLVVMLHGLGGTGANAARETGWSVKAEQEGFAVAYPDATRPYPLQAPSLRNNPQAWNDGSGRFHAGTQAVDDVAFIRSVVDAVTERLRTSTPIDPQRVFVTGFSNGASAELSFVTVEELGHVWPGGVNLLPEALVGKPTDKLKATDVIWDFFRAHPTR